MGACSALTLVRAALALVSSPDQGGAVPLDCGRQFTRTGPPSASVLGALRIADPGSGADEGVRPAQLPLRQNPARLRH